MIEVYLYEYLTKNLSVPAYLQIPEDQAQKYVVIDKIGGSEIQRTLQESRFAFQSYADSMYESAELNEELKACVKSMLKDNKIAGIDLVSDYNWTDVSTRKYRYQAVFDIYHY